MAGPWRVVALVAALGASCGGARFDGTVYRGDGFAFRIPPPPAHWRRLEQPGAALAFRDDRAEATIVVGARCGLDRDDVPLGALTAHLFLQFTARRVEEQRVVPFDGREAMHTVMSAKLDGVPLRYDAWVLKKDGCVYDLVYVAPEAGFERGRATFKGMVEGFGTLEMNDGP